MLAYEQQLDKKCPGLSVRNGGRAWKPDSRVAPRGPPSIHCPPQIKGLSASHDHLLTELTKLTGLAADRFPADRFPSRKNPPRPQRASCLCSRMPLRDTGNPPLLSASFLRREMLGRVQCLPSSLCLPHFQNKRRKSCFPKHRQALCSGRHTALNTFWPQLQPHNLQDLGNWAWQNLSTILVLKVGGGGTECV